MMAEWSIPFDVLAKRSGKRIEDVIRLSTIFIFARVIMRSPVDTGRFRGNWISAYGQPKTTVTDATDKDGAFAIAAMRGDVMAFPIGGVMYLTNSLPYAAVLEYGLYPDPPKLGSQKRGESGPAVHVVGGYSMQAPHGMVRVTAMEFDAAVKKLVQETAS